jgi:hypothetical protein
MIFLLFLGSLVTIRWVLKREKRLEETARMERHSSEALLSLAESIETRGRGASPGAHTVGAKETPRFQ